MNCYCSHVIMEHPPFREQSISGFSPVPLNPVFHRPLCFLIAHNSHNCSPAKAVPGKQFASKPQLKVRNTVPQQIHICCFFFWETVFKRCPIPTAGKDKKLNTARFSSCRDLIAHSQVSSSISDSSFTGTRGECLGIHETSGRPTSTRGKCQDTLGFKWLHCSTLQSESY